MVKCRTPTEASQAVTAVITGTGHSQRKFGSENQSSRMRGNCSGVHRLCRLGRPKVGGMTPTIV